MRTSQFWENLRQNAVFCAGPAALDHGQNPKDIEELKTRSLNSEDLEAQIDIS
jgi:hypothetical protein